MLVTCIFSFSHNVFYPIKDKNHQFNFILLSETVLNFGLSKTVSGQFPPRQLPPGQLPPANSPWDNCPQDNNPPRQLPPGQLPPKANCPPQTIAPRTITPLDTPPENSLPDNCPLPISPGQLPPPPRQLLLLSPPGQCQHIGQVEYVVIIPHVHWSVHIILFNSTKRQNFRLVQIETFADDKIIVIIEMKFGLGRQ